MRDSAAYRTMLVVTAAFVLTGCGRGSDDARNVPLGSRADAAAGETTITGEARVALDSANLLFRARAYDQALEQYRRSAALVPNEVTPHLGVLMVAEATGNTQLAQATIARIRELDPGADSASLAGHGQMVDLHSRTQSGAPPDR